MKTCDVKAALRARFCGPEWAMFFEVADATGARQRRWADAIAINLFPSRGLEIHGFEIKVSRSDWLRELKNPEKSAPVQQYCDRWWIVAPAATIAPGELPPTWGHFEAQAAGKIRQIVAAPKLTSKPVTREFVAAMLRRASELDAGEVGAAVAAEVTRQREGDESRINREIEFRTRHYAELKKSVEEIEGITGVKINSWNDEHIGRAVRAVMQLGVCQTYGGVKDLRAHAERLLKNCDEALEIFAAAPEVAKP
ncbi:hypothetical protein [Trinickia dinghuensis]|uniref:Uncharacterized protein n=1 Tax=Trinickia dinghuensis TaxID=2291023 RepID=A0A3D8K291_9BURK|nr:hypothetical protein [Trinickia dinghuensis]RDU99172.1 hypothetical protein DWV00_08580 [Trinickia dinghuensis]